jgi:hypothetical protein
VALVGRCTGHSGIQRGLCRGMSGLELLVQDSQVEMCFGKCRARRGTQETADVRNALRRVVESGQRLETLVDSNGDESVEKCQSPHDGPFCYCSVDCLHRFDLYCPGIYFCGPPKTAGCGGIVRHVVAAYENFGRSSNAEHGGVGKTRAWTQNYRSTALSIEQLNKHCSN